jgi:hypothetical protein
MDISGSDETLSSSKTGIPKSEEKPFQTLFVLNIDPQEQKVIYKDQTKSTWREYVTKKPEDMPEECWATKLFDSLNDAVLSMPSDWTRKFYFYDEASLSQVDLFSKSWRQILASLVRTMNDGNLMRQVKSGAMAHLYAHAFFISLDADTTVDGLLSEIQKGIGRSKCDWARTSNQVNCPISQMPLEKPVWLSTTGRTYSMEWFVNAVKKAFREELPLRLEDTTLYYYDDSGHCEIQAHPHLWDPKRDGGEALPEPISLHSLVEASLASMSFNKQDAKTYSIPEFSNTFMELLPGEGFSMNMDIGRVAKRYQDLRALKPLPLALQQTEQSDYLIVQHTVIKDILLWKGHLKLPIRFVNILFKNCTFTGHTCWCCMQLKRCRFENCVISIKVRRIERCEFINCEFVDCQFETKRDLASLENDEKTSSESMAAACHIQGSVSYLGCRLVAPADDEAGGRDDDDDDDSDDDENDDY